MNGCVCYVVFKSYSFSTNRDRSHSNADSRAVGGDAWPEPPPPYSAIELMNWNAAPGGQAHHYNYSRTPYHVSNDTRHHSFAQVRCELFCLLILHSQESQQPTTYNYYPSLFTERHPMQAWSQQPSDSQVRICLIYTSHLNILTIACRHRTFSIHKRNNNIQVFSSR